MAFHPRLNLQRNYVDVDKTDVFQGYRRVKFRDTPCVEPPEKVGPHVWMRYTILRTDECMLRPGHSQ